MSFLFHFVVIICVIFCFKQSISQISPCPEVFQYFTIEDKTFGIITIPNPKEGWTNVNISLGSNGIIYNNVRFIRLFKLKEDTEEDVADGKNIQYRLLLPKGFQIPVVRTISLNGKIICSKTYDFFENNWSFSYNFFLNKNKILTEHSSNIEEIYPTKNDWLFKQQNYTKPNLDMIKPETSTQMITIRQRIANNGQWLKQLPFKCGKRPVSMEKQFKLTPLILGGVNVSKGEFPWLVYMRYDDWSLLCGATLISHKVVITAAHCVKNRKILDLQFGKHNRYIEENGSISRKPEEIIIHDEYNDKAHADIALITFDSIEFTEKIFPICLWPFGLKFDQTKVYGTVAGWGLFVEDGPSSETPMKAVVPKVSLKMCRESQRQLDILATDHTFCAGGNYSGPCHGDSGSGFYFRDDKTWYLRGVVSHSLRERYSDNCVTNYYAVYVDIAFYLDWLKPYLTEEKNEPHIRIDPRFNTNTGNEIV